MLEEAAELYELYTIALYDLDGRLVQGIDGAPEAPDSAFFALLKETDNLTTDASTLFQGRLGITMGIPVKANGETALYLMGVYKYDLLNDVISGINLGKTGRAYMVNREGVVTGHPDQSLALSQATLEQGRNFGLVSLPFPGRGGAGHHRRDGGHGILPQRGADAGGVLPHPGDPVVAGDPDPQVGLQPFH